MQGNLSIMIIFKMIGLSADADADAQPCTVSPTRQSPE